MQDHLYESIEEESEREAVDLAAEEFAAANYSLPASAGLMGSRSAPPVACTAPTPRRAPGRAVGRAEAQGNHIEEAA